MTIDMPLTAVSLFSGAGGLDIGVKQAGFDVMACVEIDPHCCDTLRDAAAREKRNTQVIQDDIRNVDPFRLMIDLLLEPGELDLLCGGSPCQSFSQIGKRGCLNDERGVLLFETLRFAKVFKPKSVIIEQVKGVLNAPDHTGVPGAVYKTLINGFKEIGYTTETRIVKAIDYGVAQKRERVFVVCLKSPSTFAFPAPTHGENLLNTRPVATAGEVLAGLGEPMLKGGYQPDDGHFDVTPAGDRRRIHGVPEGSHLAKELHLPEEQRCNLSRKDTTKFLRLHRNRPSNTLRCGEIFFHPVEDRYLTPREYMRLHGYPDDYYLKGPIRSRSGRVRDLDQHRQVANSVPPPVARVIATTIKDCIRPKVQLSVEAIAIADNI